MFHEMRRKNQLLSEEESIEILKRGTSGVLALFGEDGYPYALPISYCYDGEKLYFHCAKTGHKLDAIRNCDKASFCVIDKDEVVPEKYTTYYRSVIVFGTIRAIENEQELQAALQKLAVKYRPNSTEENHAQVIGASPSNVCVLELSVEHMTGKEALELAKRREN